MVWFGGRWCTKDNGGRRWGEGRHRRGGVLGGQHGDASGVEGATAPASGRGEEQRRQQGDGAEEGAAEAGQKVPSAHVDGDDALNSLFDSGVIVVLFCIKSVLLEMMAIKDKMAGSAQEWRRFCPSYTLGCFFLFRRSNVWKLQVLLLKAKSIIKV